MEDSVIDRTDVLRIGASSSRWVFLSLLFPVLTAIGLTFLNAQWSSYAVMACVAANMSLVFSLPSMRRHGRLGFDSKGLSWDGKHLVTRSQMIDVQREGTQIDVLTDGALSGRLRFVAEDEETAETLCQALRGGGRPPVLSAHVSSRLGGSLWAATLALLGATLVPALASVALRVLDLARSADGAMMLVPVFLCAMVAAILRPTKLILGADGARLTWLGTTRWIPWSEVSAAEMEPSGNKLILRMKDGRTVEIPCRAAFGATLADTHLGPSLYERINTELSRAGTQSDATTAVLDRNGRSGDDWLEALLALGRPGGGHLRELPVSIDSLRRVLDDLSTNESLRMAASVALGAMGARGELKERAAASASPRLRVVMEAASEEVLDRAKILEALVEVKIAESQREG